MYSTSPFSKYALAKNNVLGEEYFLVEKKYLTFHANTHT